MLRLAELRLLASRWQVASIHRDTKNIVLTYRERDRITQLVERSLGRLKIIDDQSAYFRLHEGEGEPGELYPLLKHLLRADGE